MWTSPRAPRPWRRRLFTTVALLALLVPAVAALAAYPVVDVNTGLPIDEGTAKNITSSMLHVSMQNTTAGSIQYHLTSAPAHGALLLNDTQFIAGQIFTQTQLIAGQIFTQDDIDNGRLAYSHDGSDTPTDIDSFEFRAADGLGQPMTRVSVASDGTEGNDRSYDRSALSKDGRFVAFRSAATNLVPDDTNNTWDVFLHDQQTGQTTRVSVDSFGNQGNGGSIRPALSADGAVVAFNSDATHLVMGDTNGASDVFMYEAGQTTLVSVGLGGAPGNSHSTDPSISANGRLVAFYSVATNLVNGDTNNAGDIFVYDKQGQTRRVSVSSGGAAGNSDSYDPSISPNGRFVAFYSVATNLVNGDTNTCGPFTTPGSCSDVFVRDLQMGQTTRVSVASDGAQANGGSYIPSMSEDGDFVAFESGATNLVSDDTNNVGDIFVHDRQTGQTERVSVDSHGNQGNSVSYHPSISADGRFVAFYSLASNLVDGVDGDTNNTYDVFVHDRQTGQTTRVSVDSNDTQANGGSFNVSLSADGRAVAFYSNATNLVSGDTNGTDDFFVADRGIAQSFAISVTSVNDQPTLSSFADQTVLSGSSITIPFQVGDEETALDQLGLTASSSNPALVPNVKTNLSIVGDKLKPNRSLVVQPLANQTGQATITVQVSDGSVTTPQSFTFTVQPPTPTPPQPWLALLFLACVDTAPGTHQTGLTVPLLNLLARLGTMPPNPAMRLVVLYDGKDDRDSRIYVRQPDATVLTDMTARIKSSDWPGYPDDSATKPIELDTGITATLHNFIAWARKTYPGSPHTLLSIVDHGGGWAPTAGAFGQPRGTGMVSAGGWSGLALDARANDGVGTSLSTKATGEALAGLGHFDVLFLDACLMGMIETATEVQPYADYLVAGENLLWSRLPYEKYLDPTVLTSTTDPRALAQAIVQNYNKPPPADEPFAIAALDMSMSKLPGLVAKTNSLAQALLDALPPSPVPPDNPAGKAIRAAYAAAQKFDYDSSFSLDQTTDAYVDLADLAAQLLRQEYFINNLTVMEAAKQVRDAIVGSTGAPGVVVGNPNAVSGTYYATPTKPAWNFA